MKTVKEIRRENLERLVQRFGTVQALADELGRSHSQISQVRNANVSSRTGKPRWMGDKLAREIEVGLGLTNGWMDVDRDLSQVAGQAPLSPRALSIAARIDEISEPRRQRAIALIDMTLRNFEAEEREAPVAPEGAPEGHEPPQHHVR